MRKYLYLFLVLFLAACSNRKQVKVVFDTNLLIEPGTTLVHKHLNVAEVKSVVSLNSNRQLVTFSIPKNVAINYKAEFYFRESVLGGYYFELETRYVGRELNSTDTLKGKMDLLKSSSADSRQLLKGILSDVMKRLDSVEGKKDTSGK